MGKGSNSTSTSASSSFAHLAGSFSYKKIDMPPDQRDKILAMHEASRANAGMYVAVVLAMYVFLLTMLLCRYRRRFPSVRGGDEDLTRDGCGAIFRVHCCPPISSPHREEEIGLGLPLHLRPSTSNVITITIREPSSSSGCGVIVQEEEGQHHTCFWKNGGMEDPVSV